ncbi:hypothetical protein Psi02_14290 [Planotetraspora silvatica]|uniref:Uncharacterized protein n=1 Tax=Planotetraspora silvatica TaxID=234614 RepID=A0A8J3XLA7_9ACTN|nr:hypothetical protein Psi02_14290 [Planotetraspora silvatica]
MPLPNAGEGVHIEVPQILPEPDSCDGDRSAAIEAERDIAEQVGISQQAVTYAHDCVSGSSTEGSLRRRNRTGRRKHRTPT